MKKSKKEKVYIVCFNSECSERRQVVFTKEPTKEELFTERRRIFNELDFNEDDYDNVENAVHDLVYIEDEGWREIK